MKVYAGAPAAARRYVEVGRGRADDYYLAEGTGIARRFTATDGHVVELAPLSGDGYEAWVAGRDPDTGQPRGRLRDDARAVRFVEVVVNGPKSWSLAAALHPDIAAAYEGAQDRAAAQIIAWVSQHATTRVGPRGEQVPVPLDVLEAATVAHYTSRAGDPHWHLHLQFNSRVYAADKWRGLFTVDIRDSLGAINGIGHAAMATDPELNGALAAHGYSKDPVGEIRQLADYVDPFSARHQQIVRNADRYEREWAAAHPGEQAGPALRRGWDARAWAEHRPDKITPQAGAELRDRWRTLLADLGHRDPDRPLTLAPIPVGALDRDAFAQRALARLAAGRSAWNPADIRGELERLIAEAGVVTQPAVRTELAEDLTARALGRCVRLVDRDGMPEHIRAWTTPAVLAVEAELTGRLAARATLDNGRTPNDSPTPRRDGVTPVDAGVGVTPLDNEHPTPVGAGVTPVGVGVTPVGAGVTPVGAGVTPVDVGVTPPSPAGRLDAGQAAVAVVLAGDRQLVVVEGAAGAGKTTTLAAARDLLAAQARRMVVVTPTLKAAQVAGREVGVPAGSAAGLAYQYGWRWDDDGHWTRLNPGEVDPVTGRTYTEPTGPERLGAGDLLVIDESGMLDQDTARALLTLADECGVRVALVGDRHQLPAVGRGGVLDLAVQEVDPTGHLTLDDIHRFVREEAGQDVPDREYAELSLAMRAGTDPAAVFDALVARGQIRLHQGDEELQDAIAVATAGHYEAGQRVAVVVDTREQATQLNTAVRDYLIYVGRVDETATVAGRGGQPVGVGDRVATRRNDRELRVANRDTFTVVAVHPDGSLTVTPTTTPTATAAGPAGAPAGVTPAETGTGSAPGHVTPGVPHRVTPGVPRRVTPAGGPRVLPADYVREHVELAYASTAHGVQGDTVTVAHLVIGEHTGAASAYVGMTRGRQRNTAHLIAADLDQARAQWVAAFARDKADLGPGHAGQAAALAAAEFAPTPTPTPAPVPADAVQLDAVLGRLFAAWTAQDEARDRLQGAEHSLSAAQEQASWLEHCQQVLTLLEERYETARATKQAADRAAAGCTDVLDAAAGQIAADLRRTWDTQLRDADTDARIVAAGPGRLGLHRTRVADATRHLDRWASGWVDVFPGPYPTIGDMVRHPAGYASSVPAVGQALYQHAQRLAAAAHPDHAGRLRAADQAGADHDRAMHAYFGTRQQLREQSTLPDYDVGSADALPRLRAEAHTAHQRADRADRRVQQLADHPAITSQPNPHSVLAAAHARWQHDRYVELTTPYFPPRPAHQPAAHRPTPPIDLPYTTPPVPRGHGIGR